MNGHFLFTVTIKAAFYTDGQTSSLQLSNNEIALRLCNDDWQQETVWVPGKTILDTGFVSLAVSWLHKNWSGIGGKYGQVLKLMSVNWSLLYGKVKMLILTKKLSEAWKLLYKHIFTCMCVCCLCTYINIQYAYAYARTHKYMYVLYVYTYKYAPDGSKCDLPQFFFLYFYT